MIFCKKCGQHLESECVTQEGALCPSCTQKPWSPTECGRCGKKKRLVWRDDKGFAVCGTCKRKSRKEKGWECPKCHERDVPYYSQRCCRHCYEIERDRRAADRVAALFTTERGRLLFKQFTEEEINRANGRTGLADRLPRYARFFASLEEGWGETSMLTIPFLRKIFGDGLWTVWHLPMAFLTRRGLVEGYQGPVSDAPGERGTPDTAGPRRKCPECREVKNFVTYRDECGRLVCGVCIVELHRRSCERSEQGNGHHHSAETCPACAHAETIMRVHGQRLHSVQWRELFWGFGNWVTARRGHVVFAKTIRRHLEFFEILECVSADPSKLTLEDLAGVVTRADFNRRRLPLRYMVETKIIPGGDVELDKAITDGMRRRILERASTNWYRELLHGYDGLLMDLAKVKKINCWVAVSYLGVAERFLKELDAKGIRSVQNIRQKHYRDLFNRQRHKLRYFVRYLMEYVPGSPEFRLEKTAGRSARFDLSFDERTQRDIITRFLDPPDHMLKMAMIVLLMLLCAQSLKKTVRLKLGDLVLGADGIFRFGPVAVPLGKEFSAVIKRYLAQRNTMELLSRGSDYLFPGATIRGHLTSKTAGNNLKRLGIPHKKLRSSAIARYFQMGKSERVFLTLGFGVPPHTAHRYEKTFLVAGAGLSS